MKEYVMCKVCGYITEVGNVKDVCPVCGFSKSVFEPHKLTISEERRFILSLHIHPVIVHFPQAFALLGLVMIFIIPWIFEPIRTNLMITLQVLMTLLPFSLVAAMISGIYDAKVRFKKLGTPVLKKKTILGVIFFIASIVAAFASYHDFSNILSLGTEIVALLICALCATGLGRMGAELMELKTGGK